MTRLLPRVAGQWVPGRLAALTWHGVMSVFILRSPRWAALPTLVLGMAAEGLQGWVPCTRSHAVPPSFPNHVAAHRHGFPPSTFVFHT